MTITSQDTSNKSQAPAKRVARLSPELNEFLHMLDALEGQFSGSSQRVQ